MPEGMRLAAICLVVLVPAGQTYRLGPTDPIEPARPTDPSYRPIDQHRPIYQHRPIDLSEPDMGWEAVPFRRRRGDPLLSYRKVSGQPLHTAVHRMRAATTKSCRP